VSQARLRSSFIYLANAVSDLRGNWSTLAIVIAPLVLAASLCLLPDALNLQYRVAETFEPNTQSVSYTVPTQTPMAPERAIPPARQLFPSWFTTILHFLFGAITYALNLVVLCALARMQSRTRAPTLVGEAVEVYRRAGSLALSFAWIVLLQVLATVVGFVLLVIPGLCAYVFLYFAQYALVFDDRRSWPALLFSRDLMRGRFFKVAVRIVVFLAVWSGYNSWAYGIFIGVSVLLGPVGVLTGFLWATVFLVDLLAVGVTYATAAFFLAAGVRLYDDLTATARAHASVAEVAMQPTVPLKGVSA
jgi:hypothetical protein